MALKVVIFYNQFQRGFTETWYMAGTQPPSKLPDNFDKFFKSAIKFRAGGTVLTGCRFSVVENRLSTTYRFGNNYVSTQIPSSQTGESEDVVSTTAVWRFSDNSFHSKLMYVRGLQDRDVVRDPTSGADTPTAALKAAMDQYTKDGIAAGLQLRYQKTPANFPGFLNFPINNIDKQGVNVNLSVLGMGVATPPDIIAGTIFGIKGVKKNDCPGIPKIAKAIDVQAGVPATITFTYKFRNQAMVFPQNAYAFKVDYAYQNLAVQEFLAFSEHKTGRPFFQPRGKSSVALRRL